MTYFFILFDLFNLGCDWDMIIDFNGVLDEV